MTVTTNAIQTPGQPDKTKGDSGSAGDRVDDNRFVPATPLREVRLAVTMVGGSSLAIYECGASIELYRMVQGEGAYGLLKCLTNSHAYVDVLSGTSAGGINAMTLAAAIANGTDIKLATKVWVRDGSVDDLLQRPETGTATTLFRGDEYYLPRLQDAFRLLTSQEQANAGQANAGTLPSGFPGSKDRGYELDLFVTGTRYDGQNRAFSDLTGQLVYTADYNGVFHLLHAPRKRTSHLRGDLDDPGDPDEPGDSPWLVQPRPAPSSAPAPPPLKDARRVGDRLARIARTTSCLPAIFEPSNVTRDEVGNVIELPSQDGALPDDATASHWFFDGGFLNNRPVDLALEEVFRRTATVEVARKFVFVEPVAVERRNPRPVPPTGPDAAEAILFYLGVPGNQSISATLEKMVEFNRKIVSLQKQLADIRRLRVRESLVATPTPEEMTLWEHIRREDLADALAAAYLQGINPPANGNATPQVQQQPPHRADHIVADQLFAQAKNDQQAIIEGRVENKREAERPSTFLWMDLQTLQRWIDWVRSEVRDLRFPRREDLTPDLLERKKQFDKLSATNADATNRTISGLLVQLTELRDSVEQRYDELLAAARTTGEADAALLNQPPPVPQNLLPQNLQGFRHLLETDDLQTFLQEKTNELLHLTQQLAVALVPLLAGQQPADPFAWARNQTKEELYPSLRALDALLYPYVRFADLKGESPVDLVYVSARSRQGGLSASPAADKLAGDALFHLGGFFKRSWRVNDILWGRLDTADALVTMLLEPARLEYLSLIGGERFHELLVGAGRAFMDGAGPEVAAQAGRAANGPQKADLLAPLVKGRVFGKGPPEFADPSAWENAVRTAASGEELARLLKPLLLIRHQLEIVEEMVPQALAAEIAEWAEQAAQNLTSEQVPASGAADLSPVYETMRSLYPLPSPGTGIVVEQLVATALEEVERRMPPPKPAKLFLDSDYRVGAESEWRDIPFLVTGQRTAQSALVALQVAGKLVPPKVDLTLFKLPRGVAWVMHGFFLALRQGKPGRIAALSTAALLLVGIPILMALGSVSTASRLPLMGLWFLALCLGASVAHLRRGPGDSVAWSTGGLAVLLTALAYHYEVDQPKQPLAVAGLLIGASALLFLLAIVQYFDRRPGENRSIKKAIVLLLATLCAVAVGFYVCRYDAAAWWSAPLSPSHLPLWSHWAFGAAGLFGTLATLGLGVWQLCILKLSRKTTGAKLPGADSPVTPSILKLEFAGNPDKAADLLRQWDTSAVDAALRSLSVDQWFSACYMISLILCNIQSGFWLREVLVSPWPLFLPVESLCCALTVFGVFCALVAAGLDYTENLCLFSEIEACRKKFDPANQRARIEVDAGDLGHLPVLAKQSAVGKFILIMLSLVTIIIGAGWEPAEIAWQWPEVGFRVVIRQWQGTGSWPALFLSLGAVCVLLLVLVSICCSLSADRMISGAAKSNE